MAEPWWLSWGGFKAEQDPKDDWWAWIRGRRASPADPKHTFWDEERVKHDPDDTSSEDWDNSEPDADAP